MTPATISTAAFSGPDRRPSIRWLVGLAGPLGLAVVAVGAAGDGPPLCPIRRCTGHACPGCGMTRALGALVRGDVELALRYHPLVVLVGAQLLALWAIAVAGRWSPRITRALPVPIAVTSVALVAVWALRWRLGLLDVIAAP
jgi:hypothetical protein